MCGTTNDPAIALMREALALSPTESPGQSETREGGSASDAGDSSALAGAPRRERIAALVRRIEAGDLSTVAMLRELLSRTASER
jgi:hypothetical protein